jgi:hypothetical protein
MEFGRLLEVEEDRKKQVKHLNESIKLKDLALAKSNTRIELWQKSTYKLEDRLIKLNNNNDRTKWIYFTLGVLVMAGAVHGASQLGD